MISIYKGKRHSSASKIFWKIVISLVGIALILIAMSDISLFFFGESTTASIETRRVGGANHGRPSSQRYVWSVHYTFKDKDGILHDGYTATTGSDFSTKISSDRVYYFPFAPFISALKIQAEPSFIHLIYVIIGVFLVVIMNKRRKKRVKSRGRYSIRNQ